WRSTAEYSVRPQLHRPHWLPGGTAVQRRRRNPGLSKPFRPPAPAEVRPVGQLELYLLTSREFVCLEDRSFGPRLSKPALTVNPYRTARLCMLALALAPIIAAGCATDRTDLQAIKNPGASVEPVPLPPGIVRTPPRQSPARSESAAEKAGDIILTGGRQDS